MLMLPFTKGVVTTLLLFSGWLRTESGTVIRAGSFPCNYRSQTCLKMEKTIQVRSGVKGNFFQRKRVKKKKIK